MATPWNLHAEHIFVKNNDNRRCTVMRADLMQRYSHGILLKRHTAFFTKPWGFEFKGDCEGRIRIDIRDKNMLRIQCAEGQAVPDHAAMVLPRLPDTAVPYTGSITTEEGQADLYTSVAGLKKGSHYHAAAYLRTDTRAEPFVENALDGAEQGPLAATAFQTMGEKARE